MAAGHRQRSPLSFRFHSAILPSSRKHRAVIKIVKKILTDPSHKAAKKAWPHHSLFASLHPASLSCVSLHLLPRSPQPQRLFHFFQFKCNHSIFFSSQTSLLHRQAAGHFVIVFRILSNYQSAQLRDRVLVLFISVNSFLLSFSAGVLSETADL